MFKLILSVFITLKLINCEQNVYNMPLELCSDDPMTGYTRTGYCVANDYDQGSHFVCATVTSEFLEYTKSMGNDLSTPHPPYFPGLKPGDNWCLCVYRWIEAKRSGRNPPVVLQSTNFRTLDFLRNFNLTLEDLESGSNVDLNLSAGVTHSKREL